ncbi:MAG: YqcC family protein, partial [Porticoccaceae bacterium]
MPVYNELADLLADISAGLQAMNLWQEQPPSAEALASTEP